MPDFYTLAQLQHDEQARGAFLAACEQAYEAAKVARYPFDRTWWKCLAFNADQQWVAWDDAHACLYEQEPESDEERVTVNIISPVVDIATADLIRKTGGLEAVPMNGRDPAHVEQARKARWELQYQWHRQDMQRKDASLVSWTVVCGTGLLKSYWDPKAWARHASGKAAAIGAQETTVVKLFEFFPQPGVNSIEEMGWCIHAVWRPMSYIRNRWPDGAEDVSPDSHDPTTENTLEGEIIQEFVGGDQSRYLKRSTGAVVWEIWVKPAEGPIPFGAGDLTLPAKGLRAYVCNGTLLEVTEFPYLDPDGRGELPFCVTLYREMPNRFWGKGIVESLIKPQYLTNRIFTLMVSNARWTGNIRWQAPVGAFAAGENPLEQRSDMLLEYMGQKGLEPLSPPSMPAYIEVLRQQLWLAVKDIAGQHEVTNATVPSGVTAGVAIDLLQQRDRSRLAPCLRSLDRAYERWGRMQLLMASKFYISARAAQIEVQDHADVRDDFMAAAGGAPEGEPGTEGLPQPDMTPARNPAADAGVRVTELVVLDKHPFDMVSGVRVEGEGDVLPAKRQAVLDMWREGLLGDPRDPRTRVRALRALEKPGTADELAREANEDIAKENEQAKAEGQVRLLLTLLKAQGGGVPGGPDVGPEGMPADPGMAGVPPELASFAGMPEQLV